jgi:hypothetical protein
MTAPELHDDELTDLYGPDYTGLRYETALAAAERVRDRRPDGFAYNGPDGDAACFYVPSTDPRFPGTYGDQPLPPAAAECGCLVGETLAELGLLTDGIAQSQLAIGALADLGELDAEPDAVRFLTLLQSWQDNGTPWNEAIGLAAREIELTRQGRQEEQS